MRYILALLFLAMPVQTFAEEVKRGPRCTALEVRCLESVGKMSLTAHRNVRCNDVAYVQDKAYVAELEADNVRLPFEGTVSNPKPREFTCQLADHKVKVELNAVEMGMEGNCMDLHQYIPYANWYVDGKLVAEDMYFEGLSCLFDRPKPKRRVLSEATLSLYSYHYQQLPPYTLRFDFDFSGLSADWGQAFMYIEGEDAVNLPIDYNTLFVKKEIQKKNNY